MSDALVPVNLSELLPALSGGMDIASATFNELAKGSEFLERIQLFSKGKYIDKGLIAPGRWGIPRSEDQIDDVGSEIDIVPFCCRPKALDLRDRDAIITSYEPETELFQGIKALSSGVNSSCMYGPTFLIFERSTGSFYELFCGTKSMRNETARIGAFLPLSEESAKILELKKGSPVHAHGPLPCTLKAKYATKGNWGWHVPTTVPCSTPFSNLPSTEAIVAAVTRFMSVKSSVVEKVEEEAPTTKRRR
jgi:hypothetical protein